MGARMGRRRRPRQAPVARFASAQRFERWRVAVRRRGTGRHPCPARGVRDHPADQRLVVRRMGLVTRSEVEDATPAALVATTAPEDLATLEPADQDEPIERRHIEVLAVHLLVVEDERLGQALGDRMAGIYHPDPFAFSRLTPLEGASRAHQSAEDPREVGGMEHDESHPIEHAGVDAIDDLVGHLVVRDMAPPDEDIGLGEDGGGQALIRLVEGGRPHEEPVLLAKACSDGSVDPVRVDGSDGIVRPVLPGLVPDRHPDRHAARSGRTTAPPRDDDSRIASQSRAIRRPTSGGLGLGSRPSRTARNCSQTLRDATERTGANRFEPSRTSWRRSPQMPVRSVAPSQKTQISEPIGGTARPQPFMVTSGPDGRGALTTPRTSTGTPSFSSHAVSSATSSPAMSTTLLSMWAPVSNRKPPPAIAGSWRHVPSVPRRQSCQATAFTLRRGPTSPLATIRAAALICGDRLPGKATTRSRPVRSRVPISAFASTASMTIGFSSRTSTPASRHAVAWAA